MKKKRILIVLAVIVIGITFLVVYNLKEQKDNGAMILSGNVEVTETNVGFKAPGRVTERLVDEGDKVKAGDLLARLDSAEIASVVAQGRASLDEATTKLAELSAGSRSQEIEQAKAQMNAQEAELQKVKKDYERAEILYKNGAISASQFDVARSAYDARTALHRNALEVLSLVREGPRKEEINIAGHRVKQARAALTASEERLKDTMIYAPVNGVVLRKHVEAGETIASGTPVVTIGDLEQPWIKVYVKEDKLGRIKLGQKTRITVDTFKGKVYEGTVTFISSEAEFTPKNVQTQEERVKFVFGVKVRVKNVNDELKPGMPADVRIELKP
ncbi:MAG: efflux RND transporter periplasmic adaptor subunit [Proteobacteria bacterium]|nr:efflux RND transporter periplasmic adaptor subunit [Pseudomonadota bacterium]